MDDAAARGAHRRAARGRKRRSRSPTSSRCSSTRAPQGYDQIRDVLLEVVPSDETRAAARARARARARVERPRGRRSSRASGSCSSTIARCSSARSRRCSRRRSKRTPRFVYRWPLADEPLRRLLDERPAHLLTREFADWPAFLRAVLLDALRELDRDASRPGIDARLGRRERDRRRAPVRGSSRDRRRARPVAAPAARLRAGRDARAARRDAELRRADPDVGLPRAPRGRHLGNERRTERPFPVAALRRPADRLGQRRRRRRSSRAPPSTRIVLEP